VQRNKHNVTLIEHGLYTAVPAGRQAGLSQCIFNVPRSNENNIKNLSFKQ